MNKNKSIIMLLFFIIVLVILPDINAEILIYQEDANSTTLTGNFSDGDWDTYSNFSFSIYYVNYTIPLHLINSTFQIKDNIGIINYTIPTECLNLSNGVLQIHFEPQGDPVDQMIINCCNVNDCSSGTNLMIVDNSTILYEEGIYFYLNYSIPIVNNVTILPEIAYYNDTLLGYCQATDDNQLLYNYQWYLNGELNKSDSLYIYDIYQETPNSTSYLYSPGYNENIKDYNYDGSSYDLTWSSMLFSYDTHWWNDNYTISDGENGKMYFIYTRPSNVSYAMWTAKFSNDNIKNITIPNQCLNNNDINILFYSNTIDMFIECYNGFEYVIMQQYNSSNFNDTLGHLYEEGIYLGVENSTKLISNITNISGGQNWTFSCQVNNTYYQSNFSNSSFLIINNTAPVINYTTIYPSPATVLNNLTCNVSYYDGDYDDNITLIYNWTIDGILSIEHNKTLESGNFTGTNNVSCSVIANDGELNSTWVNSSIIIFNDSTSPYMAYNLQQRTGYTDTSYLIYMNCSDFESDIMSGYPVFSYIDPDGILQGNYTPTLINITTGEYIYNTTFSKVGTYTNFSFYCKDVQSNQNYSENVENFNFTSSVRTVIILGGGGSDNTANLKNCNWSLSEKSLTFYTGDNVKQLFIYNKENFSISPIYSISNSNFKVAGAKSLVIAKNVEELSILKGNINESVKNTTAILTVSSLNCKPITMSITYVNNYEELNFIDIANNLIEIIGNKIVSNVNIAGFGIKFYWVMLVIILLSISIVAFAKTSIGLKIGSGILIALLLMIMAGAIIPTTNITGEITQESMINETNTQQMTIIDNIAEKGNESSLFIKDLIYEPIVKLGTFNITYLIVGIFLFLILLGLFFSFSSFDWWANILLSFFISLIIIIITYFILK